MNKLFHIACIAFFLAGCSSPANAQSTAEQGILGYLSMTQSDCATMTTPLPCFVPYSNSHPLPASVIGPITSPVNLGTSTSATSPRIAGDATSGFYTAGAAKVDVAIGGVQQGEFTSSGLNLFSGLSFDTAAHAQLSYQQLTQGVSAPNVVAECPLIAFDPNFLSETEQQQLTSFQNALLACETYATTLNPNQFYLNLNSYPQVRFTAPAGALLEFQSRIWIPPLVAIDLPTNLFVRDGTAGSPTTLCTGDPIQNCNATREAPYLNFMPGSSNIDEVDIQCNRSGRGVDGGSCGAAFNGYQLSSMVLASGGSGFSGSGPWTCTTSSPFVAPYQGATFTCNSQSGGACNSITFAGTLYDPLSGIYPLPPFLLAQQYQSAAWTGAGGINPWAANGTDLKATCTGTGVGTGVTVTPTWANDVNGGVPRYAFANAASNVAQQWLGRIRTFQSADLNDGTYGPSFGFLVATDEVMWDYIQTQFSNYGLWITGADKRGNIHNDVGSATQLKMNSGDNQAISLAVEDTPSDSLGNAGKCAQIDNAGVRLPMIVCYHNPTTGTTMATNQLQIGQDSSYSSSTQLARGYINAMFLNNSSSATTNTALAIDNVTDLVVNENISNIGSSGSARTSQYTHSVNFTGTHAANVQIDAQISNQVGPTVIGTVPTSADVTEHNSADGKTYHYGTQVQEGNFAVINSGAISVGTTIPTSGTSLDLGSNTTSSNSSVLLPIGTSAARPSVGVNGMIRYNSTTNVAEGFINGSWQTFESASGGITTIPEGGTGVSDAQNTFTNLDTYSQQYLPHLAAALAKVNSGNGDAKIWIIGDSTGFGAYSNGSSSGNYVINSWPSQLARALDDVGIPSEWTNWIGDGTSTSKLNFNPYVTVGSGWADGAITTIGGNFMTNGASTNALSYAPPDNVDSFDIYYVQSTDSRTFTWNIDGGGNTTVNTQGDGTHRFVTKTTATVSKPGPHTLNINEATGTINIVGVDAYNSTFKQVHILNSGWRGAKAADWDTTTNDFSPLNAIGSVAPDLCIIGLTINDWNAGTNLTTYNNQLQAIITKCQASGDVVLVTGNPSDPTVGGNASLATQQNYVNQNYTLSAAQTPITPIIDIWNRWGGSYATANGRGYMTSEGVDTGGLHPNGNGYNDIARAMQTLFRKAGGGPHNNLLVGGGLVMGTTVPRASVDLGNQTDAEILPVGTTAQRPATGVNGMIRYNTSPTPAVEEGFINGIWEAFLSGSNGTPTCGTGCSSITSNSTDLAGSLTTGTTVTSITMNFSGTLAAAPRGCVCNVGGAGCSAGAPSTSAVTFTALVAVTSQRLTYVCFQ